MAPTGIKTQSATTFGIVSTHRYFHAAIAWWAEPYSIPTSLLDFGAGEGGEIWILRLLPPPSTNSLNCFAVYRPFVFYDRQVSFLPYLPSRRASIRPSPCGFLRRYRGVKGAFNLETVSRILRLGKALSSN